MVSPEIQEASNAKEYSPLELQRKIDLEYNAVGGKKLAEKGTKKALKNQSFLIDLPGTSDEFRYDAFEGVTNFTGEILYYPLLAYELLCAYEREKKGVLPANTDEVTFEAYVQELQNPKAQGHARIEKVFDVFEHIARIYKFDAYVSYKMPGDAKDDFNPEFDPHNGDPKTPVELITELLRDQGIEMNLMQEEGNEDTAILTAILALLREYAIVHNAREDQGEPFDSTNYDFSHMLYIPDIAEDILDRGGIRRYGRSIPSYESNIGEYRERTNVLDILYRRDPEMRNAMSSIVDAWHKVFPGVGLQAAFAGGYGFAISADNEMRDLRAYTISDQIAERLSRRVKGEDIPLIVTTILDALRKQNIATEKSLNAYEVEKWNKENQHTAAITQIRGYVAGLINGARATAKDEEERTRIIQGSNRLMQELLSVLGENVVGEYSDNDARVGIGSQEHAQLIQACIEALAFYVKNTDGTNDLYDKYPHVGRIIVS